MISNKLIMQIIKLFLKKSQIIKMQVKMKF
jgi:hypothetical protein